MGERPAVTLFAAMLPDLLAIAVMVASKMAGFRCRLLSGVSGVTPVYTLYSISNFRHFDKIMSTRSITGIRSTCLGAFRGLLSINHPLFLLSRDPRFKKRRSTLILGLFLVLIVPYHTCKQQHRQPNHVNTLSLLIRFSSGRGRTRCAIFSRTLIST